MRPIIFGKDFDRQKVFLFFLSQTYCDAVRQGKGQECLDDFKEDGITEKEIEQIKALALNPQSVFENEQCKPTNQHPT